MFPDTELPQPLREQIDLENQFELNELETIWMFRYHTWGGYAGGMNLTIPGSADYKNLGSLQPREVRVASGRKMPHLHLKNSEHQAKAGRVGGRIAGRIAVESGQLARVRSGFIERAAEHGRIGSCFYWNIRRNKSCVCGNHKQETAA
jgi:hypothetical protein